ncbi:MAG: site-specific DNA-methyltransferase, partial [Fusicatenibacter sp.]|nr:site-specific DNA-methyltransferase [Fusicatenibacter sp.]
MELNKVICDDCVNGLMRIEDNTVDLVYLDPPFFTQDVQRLYSKETKTELVFSDKWKSMEEYLLFMEKRLEECKRILKDTGSIFVHCDRNASHYLKVLLDRIFGMKNFQSEIIWVYKRWSNSKKGLLNNHQVILFYSKTDNFKFNRIYTDYSETTNIDQILQERVRDKEGKARYKTDENGDIVIGKSKKGVPLSDVWEIPYLNPKAKERVGYPTQIPIILLEQIIKLVTK